MNSLCEACFYYQHQPLRQHVFPAAEAQGLPQQECGCAHVAKCISCHSYEQLLAAHFLVCGVHLPVLPVVVVTAAAESPVGSEGGKNSRVRRKRKTASGKKGAEEVRP